MGYRPFKVWGLRKSTTKELIDAVEETLYNFSKTSAFDSGRRLSEVEVYLQGVKDAQTTFKNNPAKLNQSYE